MIVDDKDLHWKDRLQTAASSLERFLITWSRFAVPKCTRSQDQSMGPKCGECPFGQYFRMIHGDKVNAQNRRLKIRANVQARATEDDDGETLEV
jgi:hypothetical protein